MLSCTTLGILLMSILPCAWPGDAWIARASPTAVDKVEAANTYRFMVGPLWLRVSESRPRQEIRWMAPKGYRQGHLEPDPSAENAGKRHSATMEPKQAIALSQQSVPYKRSQRRSHGPSSPAAISAPHRRLHRHVDVDARQVRTPRTRRRDIQEVLRHRRHFPDSVLRDRRS